MTKRLPAPRKEAAPREERPPIPSFTPVPRRYRHDGWTPERQVAFIEALAETGCVDRAARLVNMAQANCYTLRRSPGAEEFRRAWDAALSFAVPKLKDIAFQRAIEGELVPVFVAGKLMGFRRKYNDKLLMFCLRHYGQDAGGKRTTINYFSTRASAGVLRDASSASSAAPQDERVGSAAEASTTTVRTVITGGGSGLSAALEMSGEKDDQAAAALNDFEGVALDAEAEAAIQAALEACAERARAAAEAMEHGGVQAADSEEENPDVPFVRAAFGVEYRGTLEAPLMSEEFLPFREGERHWSQAGGEVVDWVPVAPARDGPSGASESDE